MPDTPDSLADSQHSLADAPHALKRAHPDLPDSIGTSFFDLDHAKKSVDESLGPFDDGELYVEASQSESLQFTDGRLRHVSFDAARGLGMRAIRDDAVFFGHSTRTDEKSLARAAAFIHANRHAPLSKTQALCTRIPGEPLYGSINPIDATPLNEKLALLEAIDRYARQKDPRVIQLSASLYAEWVAVTIVKPGGLVLDDIRPLVKLSVSVTLAKGKRFESGYAGHGGRAGYTDFIAETHWKRLVDEATRQAEVNLEAIAGPAGELPVILGSGWTGILLHEAVGHGLEGDFNRKETSAFSGRIGEKVAASGVTIVDDGCLKQKRGSLRIDDEGTPGSRNILIEDGILKGYMHDRASARAFGCAPTGNGRRESFAHAPMPRMTNTFMLAGQDSPEDMIKNTTKGVYAVSFSGGQVDITSGKFVFNCTEAYEIADGRIGAPLKNMALIGDGPTVLKHISMIGHDFALDPGVGMCGKDGQQVPVGVGQPSVKIDRLTVGGSA